VGEASRATSDDSLAALGAGEQEKSLSLSGWNKSSSGRVQDRNMAQALIPQESSTAQVPHLPDMCTSHMHIDNDLDPSASCVPLMLWVLISQVSKTEDGDSAETLAAVESQVQRKLAELERQVAQAVVKISEARQKRRALLADISACTRKEALTLWSEW
jgi:hypothetical protein